MNLYWVGGNDFDQCEHSSNLNITETPTAYWIASKKDVCDLNRNNDCQNYKFSLWKYLFN